MVEKLQDRRANKEMMAILLLNQVRDKKYNCFFHEIIIAHIKTVGKYAEKKIHLGARGDGILHNSSC